jgi:hypothetical protein
MCDNKDLLIILRVNHISLPLSVGLVSEVGWASDQKVAGSKSGLGSDHILSHIIIN